MSPSLNPASDSSPAREWCRARRRTGGEPVTLSTELLTEFASDQRQELGLDCPASLAAEMAEEVLALRAELTERAEIERLRAEVATFSQSAAHWRQLAELRQHVSEMVAAAEVLPSGAAGAPFDVPSVVAIGDLEAATAEGLLRILRARSEDVRL